jgi:hypothetical protein
MKFMALSALASTWLLVSSAMWPHRPAKAILAAGVGVITMLLSPVGVFWTPARRGIAVLGGVVALSNFVFFDGIGVLASHASAGVLLLFAGLSIEPRTYAPSASNVELVPASAVAAPPTLAEKRSRAA